MDDETRNRYLTTTVTAGLDPIKVKPPKWVVTRGFGPERASDWAGGAAMESDGWTFEVIVVTRWPKQRVVHRRWMRGADLENDDGVALHRRVASGRYANRLPTNRRRKRERAKEARSRRKLRDKILAQFQPWPGRDVVGPSRADVVGVGAHGWVLPYQREFIDGASP